MVALFAALSYIVSSGFRAGESNLSKEKVDLIVTEMLDYAEALQRASQTLRINGCKFGEGGLTFYSHKFANPGHYNIPSVPADNSCHIFHPNGGGVTWQPPPKELIDFGSFEYVISGFRGVSPFGIDNNSEGIELTIRTLVTEDICIAINERSGAPNPSGNPPQVSCCTGISIPSNSVQVYGLSNVLAGRDGFLHNIFIGKDTHANELNGHLTGCHHNTTDNTYEFFHVLAVR